MTIAFSPLPAAARLTFALMAVIPPANAAPTAMAMPGASAPWFDASAVEGGVIPKVEESKISAPIKLCGWWDNPTPGNVWLSDRSGQWTLAIQGMYEANGVGPTFKAGQQLPKGAPHGYGCACITARVDEESKYVYNFTGAQAMPLKVCLSDPALKGRRPH